MGVRVTDRLLAILDAELTLEDLNRLPPAHLRKLAALLHHWYQLAEPPAPPPRSSGVLARLSDGDRAS
jgi:hypothetical protein